MALVKQCDEGIILPLYSNHKFGRHKDSHTVVLQKHISNSHATIQWRGNKW